LFRPPGSPISTGALAGCAACGRLARSLIETVPIKVAGAGLTVVVGAVETLLVGPERCYFRGRKIVLFSLSAGNGLPRRRGADRCESTGRQEGERHAHE
jgi:hypothetical protein